MNIKTKYGNASIIRGYYVITNNEHSFKGQLLHRLIMANAIGCGIPSNYHVHHIDGNTINNDLNNLRLLTQAEHNSVHKKDKPQSLKSNIERSKTQSKDSNYFRVSKKKDSRYKKGFTWRYCYYENGKQKYIGSVDIKKLEKKVREKGLPWIKLN